MLYIPIVPGGGFANIESRVNDTIYSTVITPEYAAGATQETITICFVARMTANQVVKTQVTFSNNSNVGTCRYAIQY